MNRLRTLRWRWRIRRIWPWLETRRRAKRRAQLNAELVRLVVPVLVGAPWGAWRAYHATARVDVDKLKRVREAQP